MNDTDSPFLILSLGRSRSAWLARFLTHNGWWCEHDPALTMRSIADIARCFAQPCHGVADCACAPGWELVRFLVPDLRTAVIRRPVDDVIASYLAADLKDMATYDAPALRRNMEYFGRALDRVARQPGVLVLDYAELEREDACKTIWEHCLPHPFDKAWWESLKARNIQCDTLAQVLYYQAHKAEVEAFKLTVAREMRRLARAGLIGRRFPHAS